MHLFNGVPNREVVALGWTLLHFCWQSTAVAIVYAVIDRCTVRSSASVRYGIALSAFALLPVLAMLTFVEQERLVSQVQVNEQQFVVSQVGAIHAALLQQIPAAAPAMGSSELWIAQHADVLLPGMDCIWLAGVLLLALRAAGGWWQLRLLRERAELQVPQNLRTSFERLAERYQLSRRVVLRMTDEVISPMVFGIWRTIVLMPVAALTSLPMEQLEAVLAHELAHVRRWDYLVNLLQTTVECLFFFQPAMWWLSRRTREFREVCCDEVAAKACTDPVIYAEALLHMEEQRTQHQQMAMALQGDGGTLLNRIRRVMGERAMEQRSMSGVRMAAVSMVLAGLYVAPHVAHGMRTEHKQAVAAAEPTVAASAETVVEPAVAIPASNAVATNISVAKPESAADVALDAPTPAASAMPAPAVNPEPAATPAPPQQGGMEYLQKMRDAGYPMDLDKDLDQIVSLRSLGVTPEYAKSMSQTGLGKPTLHELVTLKSLGITPEYTASLKGSVLAPANFHDVVTVKSLGITPEYARSVESLGLGTPTAHDVVSIKSVGVTPEYVAALRASGIAPANLHEAVSMKSVGVTPEYAKEMAAAGFPGVDAHELISMRAQGMTPAYAKWLKATFPDADSHALRQATVFHIDADFIAKAKANGFNTASLDKLNKLKISGLLN